ncbi:hypothetical protein QE152_g38030 [Popillia japonica]|uniref:Uncharacterized protein n=1 Tax=Popillia japonica TaxID=7064 RepID=A0AAW1I8Y4_POPJA
MDTSFDSTASLVSTVHRNLGRKRKGSSSPVSSPARRLRVSAQIHASFDFLPSKRALVKRNLLAPQHLRDADEISVLHSRPVAHPPSGITNEQRRFPSNPPKPTSITASSTANDHRALTKFFITDNIPRRVRLHARGRCEDETPAGQGTHAPSSCQGA